MYDDHLAAMSNEALGDAFKWSPYKGDQRVVHLAIADVVNDLHDNMLWMHRDTLAEKASTSRATVDRALRRLVADGWLDVVTPGGGRGNPTEYAYNIGGKPRQSDVVSETASVGRESASPTRETASSVQSRPTSIPKNPRKEERPPPPSGQVLVPFETAGGTIDVVRDDFERWQQASMLCERLANHVATLTPTAVRPTITTAWVADMERMLRLDHRVPAQVARLIAWVHDDDFWSRNILSPSKLRKQHDRLVAQAIADLKKKGPLVRDLRAELGLDPAPVPPVEDTG